MLVARFINFISHSKQDTHMTDASSVVNSHQAPNEASNINKKDSNVSEGAEVLDISDSVKERVLSKLESLRELGQQIINAWMFSKSDKKSISGDAPSVQSVAQLELKNCIESGSTIAALLAKYKQRVQDYKQKVKVETIGCQEYTGGLKKINELFKNFNDNGVEIDWDEVEEELDYSNVISSVKSPIDQYNEMSKLAMECEALALILRHMLTCDEIYSDSAQDATQKERKLKDTPEDMAAVISKIQADRMETHEVRTVGSNTQTGGIEAVPSYVKILPHLPDNLDVFPKDFQDDCEIFSIVHDVFKGKENSEKLEKKYGKEYPGGVRQHSELYIINELGKELDIFDEIVDSQLKPETNSEYFTFMNVGLSAVRRLINVVSSVLPTQQTVRGVMGLGRKGSYDVSIRQPFVASSNPDVELRSYTSTSDLLEEYNVAAKPSNNAADFRGSSTKMVCSESMSDVSSTTWYDAEDADITNATDSGSSRMVCSESMSDVSSTTWYDAEDADITDKEEVDIVADTVHPLGAGNLASQASRDDGETPATPVSFFSSPLVTQIMKYMKYLG